MSLLLNALKKAAEDKAEQTQSAPLSEQGAEQRSEDLQPLNQEALLDGEPIDFNASLAEGEPVENWKEELELDEVFLEEPDIGSDPDIDQAEAELDKPESLPDSLSALTPISEQELPEPEPPPPAEAAKQTPIYGSSDHAQVVFARKGEKERRLKIWLLLVLLILLFVGLLWWLFETLYPSSPVRARVAQLPVSELRNNTSTLDVDSSPEAEAIVEAAPPAQVTKPKPLTKPKAKLRSVKRPSSSSEKSRPRRLSIQKSATEDTLLSHLQRGYGEYQQGNYGPARIAYARALEVDSNNRDARLGLAATAMGQAQQDPDHYADQYAVAQAHYQHLLQLNPQDAAARAGLMELDQRYAQGMSIARLKEAIASQPKAAPLHYSLANRYAQQRNWPQAQAAYFNAVSLAPDKPDYHFNLAVSLDHLGKQQAALSYYQKAQSLAARQAHRFSLSALQQRVQQLQGAQP